MLEEGIIAIIIPNPRHANLPKASTLPKQSENTLKTDVFKQLISAPLFLQKHLAKAKEY